MKNIPRFGLLPSLLVLPFALLSLSAAAQEEAPDQEDPPGASPYSPPNGVPQQAPRHVPVRPPSNGAPPGAPRAAGAGVPQYPGAPGAPPQLSSRPATVTPLNDGEILLNFQAADIQAVVKAMSQMTARNFLLDPRVKGQITIISGKAVDRGAAYEIFLSALKAQGFTAVEGSNGLVKIVPAGDAKQSAGVFTKELPVGGEQMSTYVAVLSHISATQMVPLLRPLMAPTSQLAAYEGANALILTDYADNIRRMLRIVEKLDQPVSTDVTVVTLKHASALDLADLITRLAAGAGAQAAPGQPQVPGGADRFTIVPDLRTNTLLVRTETPGRLTQLQSLIEKLDVPATTGGTTRVVYLRNGEAVKLAEVLRGLLAGEARAQTAVATAGAQTGGRPLISAAAKAAESSLIQADEATNALIINASDAVYNNLRSVIEKLDVRRAQVYVEALIAEITTDKSNELGFQWVDAGKGGSGAVAGLQNFPTASQPGLVGTAVNPAAALAGASGLTLAFLGPKITLPDGTSVRSLGALARALERRSLANILSTPNLLTLDNAEAKIVVGQNVPFLTGSFALPAGGTGSATNPFQTIERKDIGIQLKIKPQISEGGGVKLEIFQEISTINTAASAGASDLVTNKRSVETRVLVDDGSTIVLGGLIQDTANDSRQAVPLLGRIPLLGALFRYKETTANRTNLMIFLRPTIIRTADDGFRMTTDRYNYIRAQGGKKETAERGELMERFRPAVPIPKKDVKNEEDESDKKLLGPPTAEPGQSFAAP